MSRIAIIADVHVGNHGRFGGELVAGLNARARAVLGALQAAVDVCKAREVDSLIIAGDLFDTSSPTPQLVAAVESVLVGHQFDVDVVLGNHDAVSDARGDHALGPLLHAAIGVVEAEDLDRSVSGFELLLVPFMPGDARVWLPAAVERLNPGPKTKRRRVLVSHVGIIDPGTPAFLRKAHDAVEWETLVELAEKYAIDDLWVGNWHEHKFTTTVKTRLGQVGALAPTGFDNPGLHAYGTMVVLDSNGALDVVKIPGPRFIAHDIGELIPTAGYGELARPAYVELHGEAEDAPEQRADLAAAVADGRVAAGVVVVHDDPLLAEVAADGAVEARKASTLEEALTTYVDTVQLDEGVDREDVRARAARYLANAGPAAVVGGSPGDVRSLDVSGFATHRAPPTRVDLPAAGLVVVTGVNGAGKSTLVDAVATALWGEDLRDDPLWRAGEPGQIGLSTSAVEVVRTRTKGGKGALVWSRADDPAPIPVQFENMTKSQAALEAVVGGFGTWRRTSVLSSSDSDTFTRASDAERKRLLEVFLGLDRFDKALAAARGDAKTEAAALAAAERTLAFSEGQAAAASLAVDAARKAVAGFVEEQGGKSVDELRAEVTRLDGLARRAKADLDTAQSARASLRERIAAARSTVDGHEQSSRRIQKLTRCPTCAQDVGPEHKHTVEEAARVAVEKDRATLATLEESLVTTEADVGDVRETYDTLGKKYAAAVALLNRAEANAGAKGRADLALAGAEADLVRYEAAVKTDTDRVAAVKARFGVLKHVEAMLGTRGVRALVLTRALKGLESSALRWLRRFPTSDGPMRVRVSGTTERASGDTADVISIRVEKARDPDVWRSYKSCSGGERRRLDIAFLFALRELAQAAYGPGGTLWCDEVFDALDAQGAQDVASALVELARDRAVVVITHNPELLAYLRPTLHLHVGANKTGGVSLEVRRST